MSVDPNAPNTDPNEKPADDKPAGTSDAPTVPADYEEIKSKLATLEAAETARQTAALSETEKIQKAADDAADRAAKLETKLVMRDVIDAFKEAKVIDPELAYFAIKGDIKIKDGEAENVKALVEKFVADKPHMVKADGVQAPQTHSSNPGAGGDKPASKNKVVGKF